MKYRSLLRAHFPEKGFQEEKQINKQVNSEAAAPWVACSVVVLRSRQLGPKGKVWNASESRTGKAFITEVLGECFMCWVLSNPEIVLIECATSRHFTRVWLIPHSLASVYLFNILTTVVQLHHLRSWKSIKQRRTFFNWFGGKRNEFLSYFNCVQDCERLQGVESTISDSLLDIRQKFRYLHDWW